MTVNKVILVGRLGKDPEIRYLPNQTQVAKFPVATNQYRNTGNEVKTTYTEWHNVVLYGKLAALAEKFLKKGNQCYIEGRIQSHKYTDRNGVEKTVYEIIGSELSLIEPKPKDTQENATNDEPPH